MFFFFFSSRRRHTRWPRDWSSDVCSSDLFADDEIGSISQQRLQDEYGRQPLETLDAVFFESFFGRNATGNPMAVDREIARRHPDLPRYWAVGDFSVTVPDGAAGVACGRRVEL